MMFQRMKKLKLNEVIENPLTNGIFHYLHIISPSIPWGDDIDAETLDLEYIGNISGQKNVSPLIKNVLLKNSTTNILSETDLQTLAATIYKLNYEYWVKEYNILGFEYNPISNYDMTESETASGTTGNTRLNTGTQTTTHTGTQTSADTGTTTTTHTGTQTSADTGTTTTTHTGTQGTTDSNTATGTTTGSADRGVYGFNSSDSVGDSTDSTESETETTASGTSTRTDNLTDLKTDDTSTTRTDNLTDLKTDNTSTTRTDNLTEGRTDNLSETDSGTHSDTRTLTRSGNVGVTTSQQMLQSEIDLWKWNFIYNVVFPSIDKVLTICNYG